MHWTHPVRIVQAVFALIVLALTAYVVSSLKDRNFGSSTVDFLLFLSCWTLLLAVPYLAVALIWFPRIAHPIVIVALEVITMIFWFAGFVALGAELPPPAACQSSPCSALQAATVFGSFEWALFVATTTVSVMELLGAGRSNGGAKPPVRTNAHLGV